jgi:hypothetical protein
MQVISFWKGRCAKDWHVTRFPGQPTYFLSIAQECLKSLSWLEGDHTTFKKIFPISSITYSRPT